MRKHSVRYHKFLTSRNLKKTKPVLNEGKKNKHNDLFFQMRIDRRENISGRAIKSFLGWPGGERVLKILPPILLNSDVNKMEEHFSYFI